MGAGKNAPLSGEPIVRMMESKGVCDMKKPRYYITLNSEETRLVLRSLIRMKNRLIQEISIPSQSVTHLYCMLFLWQIMRDRLASGKLTRQEYDEWRYGVT